jgi:hypothetical protein
VEAGAASSHLLGSVVFYHVREQKKRPPKQLTGAGELAEKTVVSNDNMRLVKRSSNHIFA